jgi:protein tyrosine phosphatase
VGRTGTFIACDWAQRALAAEGWFSVIDTVYALRQDRVAMVQTAEQHVAFLIGFVFL